GRVSGFYFQAERDTFYSYALFRPLGMRLVFGPRAVSGRFVMRTMIRASLALAFGFILSTSSLAQERRVEVTATYNGLNLPPIVSPKDAAKNAFTYEYKN